MALVALMAEAAEVVAAAAVDTVMHCGSYYERGGHSHAAGNDNRPHGPRAIAAAGVSNSTEIVEYDADAVSNVSSRMSSNTGSSKRGGRAGGRFGPRRDQQY